MSESEPNASRYIPQTAIVTAALVLVIAPVLYVLSAGPLAWVADRTGGNWYDTLFAPLVWLYEYVAVTQPWFDWYLDLWT